MKALKIFLICVGVFFLILFSGVYYLVHFVDVNKHVVEMTGQISRAIGRDVRAGQGRLTFSWKHGILFELKDLSIADDPGFSTEPFMDVDRVLLGVNLKAIVLERKFIVSEIEVDSPRIVVIRDKTGQVNASTMVPAEKPGEVSRETGKTESPSASAIALPALFVGKVSIVNGSLSFIDETFSPRLSVRIDRIDLTLREISFSGPFSFDLKADLFSAGQNVFMTGQGSFDQDTAGFKLEGIRLKTDLARISLKELNGSLPMLRPLALQAPFKGDLTVLVRKALLNAQGLIDLSAEASLSAGYFISGLLPVPLEDVALKAAMDTRNVDVNSLGFVFSGGKVEAGGVVRNYLTQPAVDLTFQADEVEAGKISGAYKLPVRLTGKTFLKGAFTFTGISPEAVLSSLQGDVTGHVLEGALEGVNIIEQGLRNIPILPGLWQTVQSGLPPETLEDINKGVTLVERCDLDAVVQNGVARINQADIMTRDFSVSARGNVNLLGDINAQGDLSFSSKVSDALARKVKDLSSLYDQEGRIYVPVFLKGPLSQPKVSPDMDYLTRKLVVNKGKEQLQKVLDKNPEVQGILNMILGGSASQESSSDGSPSGTDAFVQDDQKTSPEPVSADQAVDAIFNLFKKK